MPMVGSGKAKVKTSCRGKISFNTSVKTDPGPTGHHSYNPFSSSSEEDEGGEGGVSEDRRGRVRGRSVAGE